MRFPVALAILLAAATAEAQCVNAASVKQLGATVPGVVFTSTLPKLGQTADFYLELGGCSSWATARFTLVVSASPTKLPFLGQTLYVNPNTIVAYINVTRGGWTPNKFFAGVGIPIPNDKALCGAKATCQAGLFSNCGITATLVLTPGLELTVGK